MSYSDLWKAVRYLVLLRLAGEYRRLLALKLLSEGHSPSEAENLTGLSKYVCRGVYQRVQQRLKRHEAVTELMRRVWRPLISEVEPIVIRIDSLAWCMLCNKRLTTDPTNIYNHIRSAHGEYLLDITNKLYEAVIREREEEGSVREAVPTSR